MVHHLGIYDSTGFHDPGILGPWDLDIWGLDSQTLRLTMCLSVLDSLLFSLLTLTVTAYALFRPLGPVHTSAVLRVRVMDMPGLDE